MTLEQRSLLKYEMDNLEKIEKEYNSLGLPKKYKQKFLRLLINSVHNIFGLRIEPWTVDNYETWNKILKIYEESGNFQKVKKNIENLLEKMVEDEKIYERLERYARQHREES